MAAEVLEAVAGDLEEVEKIIGRYLKVRSGHLTDFAHLEADGYERWLRPAAVLLISRIFGYKGQKAPALAAVVQLIYLAARIHRQVPDTHSAGEEIDPRDGTQLPVLVGDYLYGRFFTTLCEADLLEFLGPLADIIRKINEAAVLRLQGHQLDWPEEEKELLAGGCRLASRLARVDSSREEEAYQLGLALARKDEWQALKIIASWPECQEKQDLTWLINWYCNAENQLLMERR
ncbi:hypothetical protein [Carboxydocella sp. JDF658]|uniref:hypothetical protein n=1 Tax=Carboxydocella sp. JDF658 TaxID=1926600 RepID=UPI0009AC3C40|nr:hypothetical protein [Carboxydocella sp. JDF658]GAW31576.1 hypothetical protein JDF658_13410 [Carboxydocella sp. JDF658]